MDLLTNLYYIQSKSGFEDDMIQFIQEYLNRLDPTITVEVINKNIYVTKGVAETYPVIVAHTDQVQTPNNNITVITCSDHILAYDFKEKQTAGLGADDKNGIFIALQAIQHFPVIKAVFFYSEEIGCIGSSGCDMEFFKNARFVVQCDRKGNDDFINCGASVELCSEDFIKACNIDTFGYKKVNGGHTDVVELKQRGLEVSCCNLSCGYYNPHTNHEVTCLTDLYNCLKLAFYILSLEDTYPHKYTKVDKVTYTSRGYTSTGSNYSGYEGYKSSIKKVFKDLKSILIENPTTEADELNNLDMVIASIPESSCALSQWYSKFQKYFPHTDLQHFYSIYYSVMYY